MRAAVLGPVSNRALVARTARTFTVTVGRRELLREPSIFDFKARKASGSYAGQEQERP